MSQSVPPLLRTLQRPPIKVTANLLPWPTRPRMIQALVISVPSIQLSPSSALPQAPSYLRAFAPLFPGVVSMALPAFTFLALSSPWKGLCSLYEPCPHTIPFPCFIFLHSLRPQLSYLIFVFTSYCPPPLTPLSAHLIGAELGSAPCT